MTQKTSKELQDRLIDPQVQEDYDKLSSFADYLTSNTDAALIVISGFKDMGVCITNLHTTKGVEPLVEGFRQYLKMFPDEKFLIVQMLANVIANTLTADEMVAYHKDIAEIIQSKYRQN